MERTILTSGISCRGGKPAGGARRSVFGLRRVGQLPVAGGWDRDGTPGLGVYNPKTGKFLLRNALGPGPADLAFVFGKGRAGWQPLSGDW